MNSLLALSDAQLIEAADLTDSEFDELERQLTLRAACLGWTGDPMRQPLETVAAIVRNTSSENEQPTNAVNIFVKVTGPHRGDASANGRARASWRVALQPASGSG